MVLMAATKASDVHAGMPNIPKMDKNPYRAEGCRGSSISQSLTMNRFINVCITRYALSKNPIRPVTCQIHRRFSHLPDPLEGAIPCDANYVPLSPISFLDRSAKVFPDSTSIVYGQISYTWRETRQRCLRLASALVHLGISPGDVVATLAPNVPAVHELHFAVPMAGAVLCTFNTRHDSSMLSTLIKHSNPKIIFVDYELLEVANKALDLLESNSKTKPPILVLIPESPDSTSKNGTPYSYLYEDVLQNGSSEFAIRRPKNEWDPISLNYTSGTSSRPKGVIYNHRGAYLNAISTVFIHEMGPRPVYLWTVPTFHCNGWCLIWGVAALGGTNICLRRVCPKSIFDNIDRHKVTHFSGAPTVLNMIVNSHENDRKPLPHKVQVVTGGSPPPPQIFAKMEEMGFRVSQLYGLTETYGPGTSCVWKPEWDALPLHERYKLKARQGVQHIGLEEVDIKDLITMESVPNDGTTIGEIMFRGNTVMCGYWRDSEATKEAFRGGWFHSGDLAVKHSNGYIEVKDRAKDVIISGGENISSVEVETVLSSHVAVFEVAVVARPDDHWGQTPCAFVKLKDGFDDVTETNLIDFCRDRLPHYMAPKTIVFGDIPRTSTGKVQKFVLREKAKAMGSISRMEISASY